MAMEGFSTPSSDLKLGFVQSSPVIKFLFQVRPPSREAIVPIDAENDGPAHW